MNEKSTKSFAKRARMFLHRAEDAILIGILALIIGIAVTQIVLRNLFSGGIIWGDVVVRILVLWIGMIGAMVASRNGNHICIDAVTRYLPTRFRGAVSCFSELFTAGVCALMSYYSLQFVRMEFEDGGKAVAQIPAWACEAIIPVAFAVIALRYLLLSINDFRKFFKPTS